MIVQIYEIQTPYEAERCIGLGVDHMGSVILSEEDWRRPEIREVVRVSEGTPAKNGIIPLFRNRDIICRVLDYYRPHYIHFCENLTDDHGTEIRLDPFLDLQRHIKTRYPGVGIVRSIPIPNKGTLSHFPTLTIAKALEPVSDLFLTDTWTENEPVAGYIGITGITCDRTMARELVLQSKIPVILAGGLSPDNVYEALLEVAPAGADSCTHTNALDHAGRPVRFRKDFNRVERFVKEVRRAEDGLKKTGKM